MDDLVLEASPRSLDEHVDGPVALGIYADADAACFEHVSQFDTRELAAKVNHSLILACLLNGGVYE